MKRLRPTKSMRQGTKKRIWLLEKPKDNLI